MSVSSPWRWWLLLLPVIGALAGVYLGAARCCRGSLAGSTSARPRGADAIMLLTGDAETRPFAAAALWKAGWAPRILISTVARDPQHERTSIPADDELNLRVLWACGVPPSAVSVLDGQAASTYDEALAAAAYLGRSAPQRLLVVTNGFHARRARWIFRRVLAGRAARITLVAAAKDDLPAEAWWQSAQGFAVISGEYMKLGFYVLRYSYLSYGVVIVVLWWLSWWVYRRKRLVAKHLGLMV